MIYSVLLTLRIGTLILKLPSLSQSDFSFMCNRKSYKILLLRKQTGSTHSSYKTLDFQTVLTTFTPAMLKTVGQALFSTGLQNPKYTAEEKKGQDYEIRTYHATNWVSISLSGMQWDAAMNTGFRKLFNYIQGNNNKKVKVEMTAPVTCRVDPGAGPACESQFTVSFFFPEEHQDNPPEPSDPEVFVEHRKEFTAYVRTFGGFSNDKMNREELLKLMESLQRDGVQFVDKPFYSAGYDSPFKLINRRNEVWVLKKEQE